MHDSGGHTSSSDTSSSFSGHTSDTSHSSYHHSQNPNDMVYYANNGGNFNGGASYNDNTSYNGGISYNTGASYYNHGANVRRGGGSTLMVVFLAIFVAAVLPLLIMLIEFRVI